MDQSTSFLAPTDPQEEVSQTGSETGVMQPQQLQQPPIPEPASLKKVNEVFATASHAFSRLSELVLQIHTTPVSQSGEQKWTMADAEYLRNSLQRFSDELEDLSKRIRTRTGQHIKADFKRRAIQIHNQQIGNNSSNIAQQSSSAMMYNGGVAGTSSATGYATIGQKRPATSFIGGQPKRIITASGTTYRTVGNPVPGIMRQRQVGVPNVRVVQPGHVPRYYEQVSEAPAGPNVNRTTVQISGNATPGSHFQSV